MSLIPQVLAADSSININPTSFQITDLGKLISNAINAVLGVAVILAFIFLIMGGIEWLTSGGDKTKTEQARGRITAAVVGLVIIAASWAIMLVVSNFLGLSIDQPLNIKGY